MLVAEMIVGLLQQEGVVVGIVFNIYIYIYIYENDALLNRHRDM